MICKIIDEAKLSTTLRIAYDFAQVDPSQTWESSEDSNGENWNEQGTVSKPSGFLKESRCKLWAALIAFFVIGGVIGGIIVAYTPITDSPPTAFPSTEGGAQAMPASPTKNPTFVEVDASFFHDDSISDQEGGKETIDVLHHDIEEVNDSEDGGTESNIPAESSGVDAFAEANGATSNEINEEEIYDSEDGGTESNIPAESSGGDGIAEANDATSSEINDETDNVEVTAEPEHDDKFSTLGDLINLRDKIDDEEIETESGSVDLSEDEVFNAPEGSGGNHAQDVTAEQENGSEAFQDLFDVLGGTVPGTGEENVEQTNPVDEDEDNTYVPGDLQQLKKGLLLSRGLDVAIIAQSGRPVRFANGTQSALSFHGHPDFGATFPSPVDDTYVYVSNSEIVRSAGGVGAITFDKDGRVIDYRMLLEGTSMNCVSEFFLR